MFIVDVLCFMFRLVKLMFFFVIVNSRAINVFYPSLKMRVKLISVNMKNGTLKMIFLTISQDSKFFDQNQDGEPF